MLLKDIVTTARIMKRLQKIFYLNWEAYFLNNNVILFYFIIYLY